MEWRRELVGCYLLSQLMKIPEIDIGLYHDDGLAVINQTPQKIEKIKKEICKIFAHNNLWITIEANKKIVDFLDVTLDLPTGRFKPFSKPATTPLYIHSKSNHPPSIIRNIPEAINKRLSEISCDEDAFKAPHYQEALRKSGYAYTLKFKPEQQGLPNQKKKRRRNIIWFNPPFNGNVNTSIGRAFINLLDKCFPIGNKLRKIFNRNTVKLSYSCTPNMKPVIDGHNKAILKNAQNPENQPPKNVQLLRWKRMYIRRGMLAKRNCIPNHSYHQGGQRELLRRMSALQQQISKQDGATTKCLLSMRKGGTTPSWANICGN